VATITIITKILGSEWGCKKGSGGKKGAGRFLLVCVTFCVVAIITHCSRLTEWQLFGWLLDSRLDLGEKSIRILRTTLHTPPGPAD